MWHCRKKSGITKYLRKQEHFYECFANYNSLLLPFYIQRDRKTSKIKKPRSNSWLFL